MPTTDIQPSTLKDARMRNWVLYIGSAVAIAAILASDAHSLQFLDRWAREDQGGHLVLVQLLDAGLQPNIDFGYSYGPLAVLAGQVWAATFGNHWQSVFVLLLLLRLVSAVLLVSIVARFHLSKLVQTVFALGLYRWLSGNFYIAHFGEQIGLLFAIRSMMDSKIDRALAGCALASLFRPAAGFVVGFALVLVVLWRAMFQRNEPWQNRFAYIARSIAPAAALEIITAAIYVLLHGAASYAWTLLPITGSRWYSELEGNFLSAGWRQYFPADQTWKGYLTNPTHLDLLVLLAIAAGVIVAAVQYFRNSATKQGQDIQADNLLLLICVGLIVLSAVTFCYGGNLGLINYGSFFWLGLFAAWKVLEPILGKLGTVIMALVGINLVAFTIFSLPGVPALLGSKSHLYAESVRLPESLFLINKNEYDELESVRTKVEGYTIAFPAYMGDVTLLSHVGISASLNTYWCLKRLSLPEELARARKQIRGAQFILLKKPLRSHSPYYILGVDKLPTEVVYDGHDYELLRVNRSSQESESSQKQ
jgi:hypothetical protein